MKIRKSLTVLLVLTFFLFRAYSYAQDEDLFKLKKGQPVIVDGDRVEYFEKKNKILAEGNVSIRYGDVRLSCDRIELDTKTQQAVCRGNVRVEHPEGVLTGDHIAYDFLKKRGEIIGGEVSAFPWFGQAQETGRVGDNEYLLKKGFITTCDLDNPHYRIQAEEIRVFPDDKVIAKNAVFYIGKVPVLWVPYYYHPIIQSRAKVQFIPGQSTDWGYFLLSAWRFHIRGNTKVDVLVDYRTKKGFAEGADLYYYMDDIGLPGFGKGLFRSYFIHQNDRGTYDPSSLRGEGTDPSLRKRFQWTHRIDFDPRTVGMIEFNKQSDEYVLKDYFYNEYEQNGDTPRNYISVISSQPNFVFGVTAEKRFHDFYAVTQKLPELWMDIPAQRLWETPFYYTSEMSGTVFDKQYAFESQPPEKVERFNSFHRLSYVSKLGFLNLTPFGTFQETMYGRNRWESGLIAREAFGGGLNVFCRFHRIFDIVTNVLGLNINGLRHIIVPEAEYAHVHQPTVDKDSLYQMDEIDSLEKENRVSLSLVSKLQTKRGMDGELRAVDLARFVVGTDYLFRMKKDRFEFKKNGTFDDIAFELELRPYEWLYLDSKMQVATKNQSVRTGSVEVSLRPWDNFCMDVGYRYEKKVFDPRNQFTFDMSFVLSPKWRFGWYERVNLHNGTIEAQQFSVTRDLHCWEVEVSYNVEGSNFLEDEHTFWIAFKIKAFPDMQIGLNRSFAKHPAGSSSR